VKAIVLVLITAAFCISMAINAYEAERQTIEPAAVVQCIDKSYHLGKIEIVLHCEKSEE